MDLLGDNDPVPLYQPPRKTGRYSRESAEQQEERDRELNNMGHGEVTEDFSDSPFSDRI